MNGGRRAEQDGAFCTAERQAAGLVLRSPCGLRKCCLHEEELDQSRDLMHGSLLCPSLSARAVAQANADEASALNGAGGTHYIVKA